MQTVIDSILLNYEVSGHKNANTILILHGWGQSLSYWQSIAKILSQKYEVILLDLPGFGSSSIPENTLNTQGYSTLISKFIKKLNLNHLTLIGHSVGGKIAIKMASGSQNLDRLILISPSGIGPKPVFVKLKIMVFKLFKLILFWLPKNLKWEFSKFLSSQDYVRAGKMRETFKKMVDERVENDATKINISTLIIWGENDKEMSIKNSKILKRLIPNSIVRIMWKTGHSPNIESPEKLSELLLEYI